MPNTKIDHSSGGHALEADVDAANRDGVAIQDVCAASETLASSARQS